MTESGNFKRKTTHNAIDRNKKRREETLSIIRDIRSKYDEKTIVFVIDRIIDAFELSKSALKDEMEREMNINIFENISELSGVPIIDVELIKKSYYDFYLKPSTSIPFLLVGNDNSKHYFMHIPLYGKSEDEMLKTSKMTYNGIKKYMDFYDFEQLIL